MLQPEGLLASISWPKVSLWPWTLPALVALWLWRNYFYNGFNKYPSPSYAAFTSWWRFFCVARKKAIHECLKLHEELGDVVRLGPDTLSFSNPEAIKAIYGLSKKLPKSGFYPVQMQVSKGRVLQSLFGTQDQDYHARLRRVVSNAFSMSTIVQYEPRVNETTQVFLDQTEKLFAQTGRVCNFKLWLQFFAFDVITQITYSRRVGFIDREEDVDGVIEFVDKLFDYSAPVGQIPILDRFLKKNPILVWLSKVGITDNSSATAKFSRARMAERLEEVEESRAAGEVVESTVLDRSDLLNMFIKAQREDKSGFFDDGRILVMTTSIAFAGSDTAAITLSAVFYHLLKNPRCLAKLQTEIAEATKSGLIAADGSDVVSWADAKKLPYLDAVIKESFRVHPAISQNLERLTPPEGIEICGEFIPGGTVVSCNPWVVHRRRDVFGDDADAFRPERWIADPDAANPVVEKQRLNAMNAATLHFGGGSRTCLGKHIALLEIYKLVPSLLKRFELELTTDDDWDLQTAWFVKPKEFDVKIRTRPGNTS